LGCLKRFILSGLILTSFASNTAYSGDFIRTQNAIQDSYIVVLNESATARGAFASRADVARRISSKFSVQSEHVKERLSFSRSVPHSAPDGNMGSVMMTRVAIEDAVFVLASDIQLMDDPTVDQVSVGDRIWSWSPLYLDRLSNAARDTA
jgi:hypothetical protein